MNPTIQQTYDIFYAGITAGLSNRAPSTIQATTNTQAIPSSTTPSTGQTGSIGNGSNGKVLATNAKATYYDPALGGINASGAKTKNGLPATSTGEGYKPEVFSAAAFPELLKLIPAEYKAKANFRGGETLVKPLNILVTDPKTGKTAIVRLNDVGPGVSGHANNHMLDLSVAAKNFFGETNISNGLQISIAPDGAKPGAINAFNTVA
jgi:hypothetical protein